MDLNLDRELATLRRMTVNELCARYAEVFGEPTNARHKEWLVRRIAWRMQASAEGGLSDRARTRAIKLARESDLRLSAPKPKRTNADRLAPTVSVAICRRTDRRLPAAGTLITRSYKGNVLQLKVLKDGFEYEGEVFGSLSAVAKKITGSHCNGFQFFRLGQGAAR